MNVPAWRKLRLCFALAAVFVAAAASAQLNEADRLERCRNNRARIAQLEPLLAQMWDDRRVALARDMLPQLHAIRGMIQQAREMIETARRRRDERDLASGKEAERQLLDRFLANASLIRVRCAVQDAGCPDRVLAAVEQHIAFAAAERPARLAAEQQLAASRTNLLALRCDEPAQPGAIAATGGGAVVRRSGPPRPEAPHDNWKTVSPGQIALVADNQLWGANYRWSDPPQAIGPQGADVQLQVDCLALKGQRIHTGLGIKGPFSIGVAGGERSAGYVVWCDSENGTKGTGTATVHVQPTGGYSRDSDSDLQIWAAYGPAVIYPYRAAE
jgi:hypothetical protein